MSEPRPDRSGAMGVLPVVGWTLVVVVALVVAQSLGSIASVALLSPGPVASGLQLSVGVWAGLPVVVGLVVLPAALRGRSIAHELALGGVGLRTLGFSLLATLAVTAVLEGVAVLAHRPVPPFIVDLHRDPGPLALLVATITVAVPLTEEILFRGYLFGGLARATGERIAVIVSAGLFAAIHIQYEVFEMGQVFAVGLFLGLLRARTGSVYMPVLGHGLYNLLALVHIAFELEPVVGQVGG